MRIKPTLTILLITISLFMLSTTTIEAATKSYPSIKQTVHDSKMKQLQQLLADTGFYPGQITGVLDSNTKNAIILAQKTFNLRPTGNYEPILIDILSHEAHQTPKNYRRELSMTATAYTSQDPGSGNLTKREHYLRKGLVAVDPRIIPLGTRLFIIGYGYAIADDIGGAIKGHRIDLAFENRQAALQFGRKTVKVLVLN
jgi:3D (Asp-Asp-Asp) domain-containing protein